MTGCGESAVAPDGSRIPPGTGRLSVFAEFNTLTATNLSITVTAPDLPQALVFNLPVTNGTASGSVTVPTGANRLFTIRAFDAQVETHRGTRTVTVVEGTNPALAVALLPLAGTMPVTVTFGAATVTVTPATLNLRVGDTARFSATLTDAQGNVVPTPVIRWASEDTRRLTIDSTGLATARDTGAVRVIGVSSGAARAATVAIAPAVGPAPPAFLRTWVGGDGAGSQRNDWSRPNNWAPAVVPTVTDSVVIGAAAFAPLLVADTFRVRDLVLQTGGTLQMNGWRLRVANQLVGLGGTVTSGAPGFVLLPGARFQGVLPARLNVATSGTVALADSATISEMFVGGAANAMLDLAGRRLRVTGQMQVFTGGLLEMNGPTDSLDVGGTFTVNSDAASHVGSVTDGVLITRGNFNAVGFSAGGNHRTEFAGTAVQNLGGPDNNAVPANVLRNVVFRGAAVSHCNWLRITGTLAVQTGTVTSCTSFTLRLDGPLTVATPASFTPYRIDLGDATGTANVVGAFSPEFTFFAAPSATVRAGLAYQNLNITASTALTDSIRTTGTVTVSGAGTVLALSSPNRQRFGAFVLSTGGAFVMDEVRDSVEVTGTFSSDGGADLNGRLTEGVLRVGGVFNGGNFNATGNHLVILGGASATTPQRINSMNFAAATPSAFQRLRIENTGAGVDVCGQTRVRDSMIVATAVPIITCSSFDLDLQGPVRTVAGSTMSVFRALLSHATGTANVLGAWAPATTVFGTPNAQVNSALTYQAVRFQGSNTLPATLTTTGDLVAEGTGTVLTLAGTRLTVGGDFSIVTNARLAMSNGDSVQVNGAVTMNSSVASTPSGGQLAVRGNLNLGGLAPAAGGTFKLLLNGSAARQTISNMDAPRVVPRVQVANGLGMRLCSFLTVPDTFAITVPVTGPGLNNDCGGFALTVTRAFSIVTGAFVNPAILELGGTSTLAGVAGTVAPTTLRYVGTAAGALPNLPNVQYADLTIGAPYVLTNPLTVSGSLTLTGAGTQLDLGGRRLQAGDMTLQGGTTIRMVNAADSLIVGTGQASGALSIGSATNLSGLLTAGTIIMRGGLAAGTPLVSTGTHRVVFSDSGLAPAARTFTWSGGGTYRAVRMSGTNQLTVSVNTSPVVNDTLQISTPMVMSYTAGWVLRVNGPFLTAAGSTVNVGTSGATLELAHPSGTSGIAGSHTASSGIIRFLTAATVQPSRVGLQYHTLDFRASPTFTGAVTMTGDLNASLAGTVLDLAGQTITVGDAVAMSAPASLVMSNAASTLVVNGTAGGSFSAGAGPHTLTSGTMRLRNNSISWVGITTTSPIFRVVVDGTVGATPQTSASPLRVGVLRIEGTRGLTTGGWDVTVNDSLSVAPGLTFGFTSGGIDVGGILSTGAASTLTTSSLVLRDTSSLNQAAGTVNVTGTLAFANGVLPQRLPTAARFTYANVDVRAGASVSVDPGTARIGSGTSGGLTVDGTLTIPDGSAVRLCGSSSSSLFAANSPTTGTIRNLQQGLGELRLSMAGPLTATTFGSRGGTFGGALAVLFSQTTGC